MRKAGRVPELVILDCHQPLSEPNINLRQVNLFPNLDQTIKEEIERSWEGEHSDDILTFNSYQRIGDKVVVATSVCNYKQSWFLNQKKAGNQALREIAIRNRVIPYGASSVTLTTDGFLLVGEKKKTKQGGLYYSIFPAGYSGPKDRGIGGKVTPFETIRREFREEVIDIGLEHESRINSVGLVYREKQGMFFVQAFMIELPITFQQLMNEKQFHEPVDKEIKNLLSLRFNSSIIEEVERIGRPPSDMSRIAFGVILLAGRATFGVEWFAESILYLEKHLGRVYINPLPEFQIDDLLKVGCFA